MSTLRLQNNVPPVYVEESRDFQLFCRLYDCIVNGLLFDVNTTIDITDTKNCRSNMLPLLQTKLGFFTSKTYNDESLRMALEAFPVIVKNKGSKKAIQQAVHTFLKINDVKSDVMVSYVTEKTELENGYTVEAHTVIIGITGSVGDTSILEEIFRYILPAGVNYYFYLGSKIESMTNEMIENNAEILLVTHNIDAEVMGSTWDIPHTYINNEELLINPNSLNNTISIMNIPAKYEVNAFGNYISSPSNFLGFFNSFPDSPNSGNICFLKDFTGKYREYIYANSQWNRIRFLGTYSDKSNIQNPQQYDIVYEINNNTKKYYIYNGSSWIEKTDDLFVFEQYADKNGNDIEPTDTAEGTTSVAFYSRISNSPLKQFLIDISGTDVTSVTITHTKPDTTTSTYTISWETGINSGTLDVVNGILDDGTNKISVDKAEITPEIGSNTISCTNCSKIDIEYFIV